MARVVGAVGGLGAWFWMRGLMMRSDDVMQRLWELCGSAHKLDYLYICDKVVCVW